MNIRGIPGARNDPVYDRRAAARPLERKRVAFAAVLRILGLKLAALHVSLLPIRVMDALPSDESH